MIPDGSSGQFGSVNGRVGARIGCCLDVSVRQRLHEDCARPLKVAFILHLQDEMVITKKECISFKLISHLQTKRLFYKVLTKEKERKILTTPEASTNCLVSTSPSVVLTAYTRPSSPSRTSSTSQFSNIVAPAK